MVAPVVERRFRIGMYRSQKLFPRKQRQQILLTLSAVSDGSIATSLRWVMRLFVIVISQEQPTARLLRPKKRKIARLQSYGQVQAHPTGRLLARGRGSIPRGNVPLIERYLGNPYRLQSSKLTSSTNMCSVSDHAGPFTEGDLDAFAFAFRGGLRCV